MPDTVQRFAVLLRKAGAVELLGCIHQTEQAARAAGAYWQAASPCGESAEVVSFSVPTQGAPVQTTRDLFASERK